MHNLKQVLAILLVLSSFLPGANSSGLAAEAPSENKKPLWEVGLYNSAMVFPHYRGSDDQMYYFLALPYFIYRGKIFKADRDGLKGIFFKSERVESNISLSGYPPVIGDNEAREGMAKLGALFGIGPELKWYFNNRKATNPLYLATAVHAVSSLDFDAGWATAFQGLRYSANLIYRNNTFFRKNGSFFGVNAGLYYADSSLNNYFYGVEQQDVRADRPYYRSAGGHSGHSVHAYVIYGLSDVLGLGLFGRWDNVRQAVYHDSPLIRLNDTYTGGISLIWKIAESKKLVAAE